MDIKPHSSRLVPCSLERDQNENLNKVISANRITVLHDFFENVITELFQSRLLENELILGLKVR